MSTDTALLPSPATHAGTSTTIATRTAGTDIPSRYLPSSHDLYVAVTPFPSPLRDFDPQQAGWNDLGTDTVDALVWRDDHANVRTQLLNRTSRLSASHRPGGWRAPLASTVGGSVTTAALLPILPPALQVILAMTGLLGLVLACENPRLSPFAVVSHLKWRRNQKRIRQVTGVTITRDNLWVLIFQAGKIARELSRYAPADRTVDLVDLAMDVARLHDRAEALSAAHIAAVQSEQTLRAKPSVTANPKVADLPDMVSLHALELESALTRVNTGIATRIGLLEQAAELAVSLRPLADLIGDSVSPVDVTEVQVLATMPVTETVTELLNTAADCRNDGALSL